MWAAWRATRVRHETENMRGGGFSVQMTRIQVGRNCLNVEQKRPNEEKCVDVKDKGLLFPFSPNISTLLSENSDFSLTENLKEMLGSKVCSAFTF